jgi:hypothetical protein
MNVGINTGQPLKVKFIGQKGEEIFPSSEDEVDMT